MVSIFLGLQGAFQPPDRNGIMEIADGASVANWYGQRVFYSPISFLMRSEKRASAVSAGQGFK